MKVGDKVRCVAGYDDRNLINTGDEFVVKEVTELGRLILGHSYDYSGTTGWSPEIFVVIESLPLNHARAE